VARVGGLLPGLAGAFRKRGDSLIERLARLMIGD
jgi:hypothetical protein